MSAKTEFQITRKFGPAFSQKLTNLSVSHSPHFMRSNLDPISTISVRAVEGVTHRSLLREAQTHDWLGRLFTTLAATTARSLPSQLHIPNLTAALGL